MRALAATNPAAPLTTNEKIGLAVGATLLAIGIGGIALTSSSTAAAAPVAGSGGAGGAGAGSGGGLKVGPPVGVKSGAQTTWTSTTVLTQGQTYRASADVADALAAMGFTVYTDHEAPPAGWPSNDLGPNRWRVEGVWTAPSTTLATLFTTVPADLLLWEGFNGAAVLGAGGGWTWTPTTTLTKGNRYRASIDARADLAALGFTIWDQYDSLPGDWPAGDTGTNRWHIEGPWLEASTTFSPSAFQSTLESMGVPTAVAASVASSVRFWAEG